MFEIILLTGLVAAVLSQFLPEEEQPPVTKNRHKRRPGQKNPSGKARRQRRHVTKDVTAATSGRYENVQTRLRSAA